MAPKARYVVLQGNKSLFRDGWELAKLNAKAGVSQACYDLSMIGLLAGQMVYSEF